MLALQECTWVSNISSLPLVDRITTTICYMRTSFQLCCSSWGSPTHKAEMAFSSGETSAVEIVMGAQPVACGPYVAQDDCECGPIQNCKYT